MKTFLLATAVAFACTQSTLPPMASASPDQAATNCTPLETGPPNAEGQKPAFPGQTRVCGVKTRTPVEVTVVATGLSRPWAVEPLAGGDFLVTEKEGQLRIVSAGGRIGEPIAGVPAVDPRGQGGLLDVALSPSFNSDRTIYWSYSEPRDGGNATSVARGALSSDRTRLTNVKVIFRALPTFDGRAHYGSRLAFGRDGMLYITLGDRSSMRIRPQAQHMDSHMGKTIRIAPDGSVPKDNPFVGRDGALPEIWSVGHRNIQSAAFDEQGRYWEVEHGPQGGDELNLVVKGKNYGWPIQSFGEEYSGDPIATAATTRPGMEDPVYYWDPVIAPSGMEIYSGSAIPEWKGNIFVGGLASERLVRLVIQNNRVTGEEHLLTERGQRVRDVRQGPDGALYVVNDDGELLRISRRRS